MSRTALLAALSVALTFGSQALAADAEASPAKQVNIGDTIENFGFRDIRYLGRAFSDLGQRQAYVVIFTTLDCPVVQRYMPRIKELEAAYRDRGVQFVSINVGPNDAIREVAYQAVRADLPFPHVKDFDGEAVRALGVTRVPQVAVLDADRKLRYRGRIDSQYRTGGVQPGTGREDLKLALDAVLSGAEVELTETPVDGCLITLAASLPAIENVTYAEHVGPILQNRCEMCHRPNSTGPFNLLTYDDAVSHAEMIAEVVREQRMPPCYASIEQAAEIVNRQELTAQERDLVIAWCRGDRAAGDLSKAPQPRQYPDTKWVIGEPDLVVTMQKAIKIPADGIIPYKYVFLPQKFEHDTWVTGVQIMPGNAKAVHHCNLACIQPGGGYADAEFLTGYVPGGDPFVTDPGDGFCIKKGSILVLQIHYVTTGEATTDQTSVGIRYCRGKVDRQVHHFRVTTGDFAITPGDPHHRVASVRTLPADSTGIGMFSHMHVRGKDMTFLAHYPDGRQETILAIPNYSFDWQMAYRWAPGQKKFPAGTQIEVIAHYDNSAFNPYNPDPTATVKEGDQTFEEMMYGFFFYTEDNQKLNLVIDPSNGKGTPANETAATPTSDTQASF